MKVVLFAGGKGSRLLEETSIKPKPMIEIGNKPILWHIMKIYSEYGYNDFIICLGYKGYVIKEWFSNYFLHNSDVTIDLASNEMIVHNKRSENWKVTLVDTGIDSGTAYRLRCIENYIDGDDFMLTYGDGLSDINIGELVKYHKSHGKIATMTTIMPEGRFGSVKMGDNGMIEGFFEKVDNIDHWVNGGFFVLKKDVFKYISDNQAMMWEKDPLERMTSDHELMSYRHHGFWRAMDMLRDKVYLDQLWDSGQAKWKIWKD